MAFGSLFILLFSVGRRSSEARERDMEGVHFLTLLTMFGSKCV